MITKTEREYLRDLAKQQREIACLPVMEQRKKLWTDHNACRGVRPLIYADVQCLEEMLPPLRCRGEAGELERQIVTNLTRHRLIDCDGVIPGDIRIPWRIQVDEFGIVCPVRHARDDEGRALGYAVDYPITTLRQGLPMLKPAVCRADREATLAHRQRAEEILGDILPVRIENRHIIWFPDLTQKILSFMSMENFFLSMYDEPEQLKELMDYLTGNTLDVLRWEQDTGLLTLNNGNDYAGSGSLGFSDELPQQDYRPDMNVRLRDLWLNTNSQETVGVSPSAFREFFYPSYREIAKAGGLLYYGCCEPVHGLWAGCLEHLPNLRKVSISKWCDEDYMGEALRRRKTIYCRKPDPNLIGVGYALDEDAFASHIKKTLTAARGCEIEFSFRDIYTQCGNVGKLGNAIKILRRLIDQYA